MTTVFKTKFFKPRVNAYTTKQFIRKLFLKLCTNDVTLHVTTVYLAQGHVSPKQESFD